MWHHWVTLFYDIKATSTSDQQVSIARLQLTPTVKTCGNSLHKSGWNSSNIFENNLHRKNVLSEQFRYFLSKHQWNANSNSKLEFNNFFMACSPRSSGSINRRHHWRLNARVWNTKLPSLSKLKQSFSQSFSSTNISKLHNLSHYILCLIIFWVCVCKSLLFEI